MVVGESEYEYACRVPGNAVAEIGYTRVHIKSLVKTVVRVNDRAYTVGMECENPSALEALAEEAEAEEEP